MYNLSYSHFFVVVFHQSWSSKCRKRVRPVQRSDRTGAYRNWSRLPHAGNTEIQYSYTKVIIVKPLHDCILHVLFNT